MPRAPTLDKAEPRVGVRCPCCGWIVPLGRFFDAHVPEAGTRRGRGRPKLGEKPRPGERGFAWSWRALTAGERGVLIAQLRRALAGLEAG